MVSPEERRKPYGDKRLAGTFPEIRPFRCLCHEISGFWANLQNSGLRERKFADRFAAAGNSTDWRLAQIDRQGSVAEDGRCFDDRTKSLNHC